MAGQRVEVLFLVVVERGVLTHSSINLERIGEELFGERIEDDLRLGHCTLLSAQFAPYTFTTECLTVTLTVDGSWRVEKTSSHPRHRRANGVVEHTQVTAQFSGDTPEHANVFADEFAGRVDEGRDGSARGDDVQHATRGAAVRKGVEQRRFGHTEPGT